MSDEIKIDEAYWFNDKFYSDIIGIAEDLFPDEEEINE